MQILSVPLDPVSTYRLLRYTAKGRISSVVHLLARQHRGVWRHTRKRPTRSEEDAGPGAVTVMHANPVDSVSSPLGAGCDLPWRALVQIDHKDGGRVSVDWKRHLDAPLDRVRLFARLSQQPRVFRPLFIRQYLIRFWRRSLNLQLSALARWSMPDSTSVPCSGSLRPLTGLLQLEVDSSTSRPMSWFVRQIAVKAILG
ncbi:hypothetical protein FRC08_005213 [Ceratobasidium sp. 394]|nr:hypothetical protein FRC08_005213 [Ceratobasidium sp. 394]